MTDREIMQQAFEAFEDLKKSVTRDGTVSENWDAYYEKEYYALEALRQALAQPEQEPVRWFQQFGDAPPKQWVGLTDDEINDFDKKLRDNGDYCSLHFAWGISAKLKEKNGGSI